MKPIEINQGDVYGRLTIMREYEPYITPSGKKFRKVEASCECGTIKSYHLSSLRSGHTTSCGCYRTENKTTHGLCHHHLHTVWSNMIQRCSNPNHNSFKNYGGRGVTVCESWKNSFETFYNDMLDGYKKSLQIDRIDNDKGYSKENCRWATRSENNLNRRICGDVNYRGVSFNKESAKYRAHTQVNGKSKYIGIYQTQLEAAQAYDDFIKANNLPNQLNF